MSAFVLERKYALQLPTSYVDIDKDEMEYVDGGFYVSNSKILWFLDALSFTNRSMGLAGKLAPYIPVALAWFNALPGIGQVAFVAACASAVYVAGKFAYAAVTGKGVDVGITWYGKITFDVK